MLRFDTDPFWSPADAYGMEAKMFASAHLSSALAGINRDGRSRAA